MPGITKTGIQFPYTFERHGRVAKVKFWPTKKVFCTYFWFVGRAVRNTFSTFEAAYRYLDREFTKLDRDPQISVVPYPLQSSVRIYHELEQLLATRCGAGVSLREAVDFFLAHRETKQFKAQKVRMRGDLPRSELAPQGQPELHENVQVEAEKVRGQIWYAGNSFNPRLGNRGMACSN